MLRIGVLRAKNGGRRPPLSRQGLSHMRRKYLGCHPGRSAARSGALQTRDPSTPAPEKRHGRGTWIPALATLGRDDNGGNGAICDCPASRGEVAQPALPCSQMPPRGPNTSFSVRVVAAIDWALARSSAGFFGVEKPWPVPL